MTALAQYQRHLNEFPFGNLGAAATLDFSAHGYSQSATLNASCTLAFTPPLLSTAVLYLRFVQDGTGGHALSFPAAVLGNVPQPNQAANAVTTYEFYWDGSRYNLVACSEVANGNAAVATNYAAARVAAWWVNGATGSDANDGKTSGTAFATVEKLQQTLCPQGTLCIFQQSTSISVQNITGGTFLLNVDTPAGSAYTISFNGSVSSSASITLSSVVDTVPTASPVRGRLTTSAGTFVDKKRIRATSGANAGAITYSTGLTSATDTWVKEWQLGFNVVHVASGATVVVDTLTASIAEFRLSIGSRNGTYAINDLVFPNGTTIVAPGHGSASALFTGCEIGTTGSITCRCSGNAQYIACNFPAAGTTFNDVSQPLLRGSVFLGQVNSFSKGPIPSFQGGNCFNGGSLYIGAQAGSAPGAIGLDTAIEWTNGSGTAITVAFGEIGVLGQQFGFGGPYAVGVAVSGGAQIVAAAASLFAIPATQQVQAAGQNKNYSDIPFVLTRAKCGIVLLSDPTSPSTSDPIKTSGVANDSSVPGSTSKDAFNFVLALIASSVSGVSSVFGRAGAVVALAGDYAASKITNDSGVPGSFVRDALNNLLSQIAGLPVGVTSVFTRSGAVTSQPNDYAASQITNDSSVLGSFVSGALNTLKSQIASVSSTVSGLVTGVSSVFGRSGAITPQSGDYNSSLITNNSFVNGSDVTSALNSLFLEYESVVAVAASRDIALTDRGALLATNGTSTIALTIPTDSTTNFPVGTRVSAFALSSAPLLFVAASGVTLFGAGLQIATKSNAIFHAIKIATNTWVVTCDVNSFDASEVFDGTSDVGGPTVTNSLNRLYGAALLGWVSIPIVQAGTTNWTFNQAGFAWAGSGVAADCWFSIGPIPPGLTLQGIRVYVMPSPYGASLPGTMPRFALYQADTSSYAGQIQVGSTVVDSSASVPAYNAVHPITLSGLTAAPSGVAYWLQVFDEHGTHAHGIQLMGIEILLG